MVSGQASSQPPSTGWRGPVFIGGTGRSGTTIVGRMLGEHSEYADVPVEIRFHTETGGLLDVLENKATPKQFVRRLESKWFDREREGGARRGIGLFVDHELVASVGKTFRKEVRRNPLRAAHNLLHAIVDPVAEAEGRPAWVESTPATLQRAGLMAQVLPDARFVHMVRDGRDVAASVADRPWGPPNPFEGLEWWAERAERTGRGLSELPEHTFITIQFEALAALDRAAEYDRLLDFLELHDQPAMRRYFDEQLTAKRARIGRWRRAIPTDLQDAFEARYTELCEQLTAHGIQVVETSAG